VEQITADRMIINLFLLFAVFVGISGPIFYVGDAEWASLVANLGSNIMYDAMLQGRTVPGTMQGYMITQGYAALWLWFGIFAIIMGPRLVTRDNNGQTTDLLMGNPIRREKLLFERILAVSLQWISVFVVISISSIIGQASQGDTTAILHSTILFAEATFLYWAWTMIGVMIAVFLNNRPRLSTSVFAGVYLLILLPYIFSGINPALEPLAQLTPFYWYDPFAIFVEQTLNIDTIAPIFVYILSGLVAIVIALYRYQRIDVVDTFEDKSLEAKKVTRA
jgi:ABC-2 type transport system permease protein